MGCRLFLLPTAEEPINKKELMLQEEDCLMSLSLESMDYTGYHSDNQCDSEFSGSTNGQSSVFKDLRLL